MSVVPDDPFTTQSPLSTSPGAGGLIPPRSAPSIGSSRAESGSRWMVACAMVRSAEAGQDVATGPVSAARTGSALRASGRMASTRPPAGVPGWSP